MPPWTEESPLSAGFGAAAGLLSGIQQGQQAKAEAARQAAIDRANAIALQVSQRREDRAEADERRKEQDDADKEARLERLGGVGLTAPDFTPKPVKGQRVDPTQATVTALLARADWYDKQGATDAAKADRTQAAAIMAAVKTQAQTGLIGAQTTTEGAKPGLIKAQTKNVSTQHDDRMKALEERRAALAVQYQEAQLRAQTALEANNARIAAEASRQAASIAAAMARLSEHEDFEEQQQGRTFKHQDKALGQREQFQQGQQARTFSQQDRLQQGRANEQNTLFNAKNPDATPLPTVGLPAAGGVALPAPSNGKYVNRADVIRIGAQRGMTPDAAIKDAQAHGYTVR